MNNNIDYEKISEKLNGKKFDIPNYQRGYKWREKDVEHLIDDIVEIEKNEKDYCLQPIVVALEGENYILVDGQQRLTTIWLIINWANHNGFDVSWNFDINYLTREKSKTFLSNVKNNGFSEDDGSCDSHYLSLALQIIKSKKANLHRFLENLNEKVKVIWYEIDPNNGPAHFERLNSAKIGLTNAELVKALLLTKTSSEFRKRMACEWDVIEYKLQDENFFSFITSKNSVYKSECNRIELLLDLYTETKKADKEKDEYCTFNRIACKVENKNKSIKDVWRDIQNIHNRLLCWFDDNYLYNLIGFLIEVKGDGYLPEIWQTCKDISMKQTKEKIRNMIIGLIPSEDTIQDMVYGDGRTKNVLLLFNILSLMSKKTDSKSEEYKYGFNDKFHFALYKKENWDKEHVHATASQYLQSKIEWINWLKDLDYQYIEERLKKENRNDCLNWIKNAKSVTPDDYENIKNDKNETFKSLTKEKFSQMFDDIVKCVEGKDDDLKQNSIGNLVLLPAKINRSGEYKVAPFSTKRRIIMDRVKNGQFVPLGTQNVFMKTYTPNPGHFYKWEKDEKYDGNDKSDREYYIDAIVDTINRIKG